MVGEQALLSTEIVNRGIESSCPDAGSLTFSVRVCHRLPDFGQSMNLKYLKLGYHYLINHAIYLATIPVLVLVFSAEVGSISREGLWTKIWEDTARYDLATLKLLLMSYCFSDAFILLFFLDNSAFDDIPDVYIYGKISDRGHKGCEVS
ncbi:hypothetical protein IFM89_029434 [Coptis chinensis]|uniref:Uncharacterized protein n=1 Tax=Coptis chinensis TaxID=261450 RepID=A0A835M7I6_9MAGN|nr:hypothetical protein IFM89_029434 [Coptis chinensis]